MINISIKKAKAALVGKHFHYYSGWNGETKDFIIRKISRHSRFKSLYVIRDDVLEKSVIGECLINLMQCGRYVYHNAGSDIQYEDLYTIADS